MVSPASNYLKQAAEQAVIKKLSVVENDLPVLSVELSVSLFKMYLNQLSRIKSSEKRTKIKREAVESFLPWINKIINQSSATLSAIESQSFVWLLVWALDIQYFATALAMAEVAVRQDIQAPDSFSRNTVEIITEEIAGYVLSCAEPESKVDLLNQLADLVEGQDMNDLINAKLYKARGLSVVKAEPDKARLYWLEADRLYPKVGIKRLLKMLDKPKIANREKARDNVSEYSLSASAAGKLLNLSVPAVIRHASKNPDLLPHISIKIGAKTLRRFKANDVKNYYLKHLVKG